MLFAYLVNQNGRLWPLVFGNQLCGVVLFACLDGAQVSLECLLSPGDLGGVADGGECRDGGVGAGVFEEGDEGAVAAHRVAGDGHAGRVHREQGGHQVGQLLGHVVVHLVVLAPLAGSGVDVEPGPAAKVVTVVLSGNVQPSGTATGNKIVDLGTIVCPNMNRFGRIINRSGWEREGCSWLSDS